MRSLILCLILAGAVNAGTTEVNRKSDLAIQVQLLEIENQLLKRQIVSLEARMAHIEAALDQRLGYIETFLQVLVRAHEQSKKEIKSVPGR